MGEHPTRKNWVSLEDSERLARATLDSLSAHIAIVDDSGDVITVNRAWREFAEANGARGNVSEGANYFSVCGRATGKGSDYAAAFEDGMRAVLSGEREEFTLDYPCHAPSRRRWFVGRVTRFPLPGPPRAVVSHEEITEVKLRDEALDLRDRAIAASSSGVVITDPAQPDNPIVYANPAFRGMTGYTAEEVIGRNCRFLQGEDRDQAPLDELRAAVRDGRECKVMLRNYRKDGALFWNELNVSPVYDGEGRLTHFIGVQSDVTGRRLAEKERERLLSETQAARVEAETARGNLNTILDNLGEGVLVADARGRVDFANPTARAMLGVADREALRDLPDLWEDFHLSTAVAYCARSGEGVEARVRHGESYLRVRLERMSGGDPGRPGRPGRVLVVMQDLSEGHRLEANQQRFLANAAHQLRTPTMAIMGAAELLATGEDDHPDMRRRLLDHIFSEGRRMQRLSDALLRLSRVGWDLREPELEAVDLLAAARRAAEVMEPLAESDGLRLVVEGEETWVEADPGWLQEVLLVLLSNAVKHSSRGGDIRVYTGVYTGVGAGVGAAGGVVTVEDEGVGISPVDLPHVFERFYRGRGSSEGFGLGLPISRELTEQMGGRISVRSREGVGTTFSVELPEAGSDAQHNDR